MIKMRTGRRKRRGGAGDDVKAVKSSEVLEGILTGVGTSDESSEDK